MNRTSDAIPWLAAAVALLAIGTFAGLSRIGWHIEFVTPEMIFQHGPLMVTGFLGTLITLERAVALRQRPALLGAVLFALGGLVTAFDISLEGGRYLTVFGSLSLVLIFGMILQKHRAAHTWVMSAGAVFLLGGSLLWLSGRPVIVVVPWWMAFLVLTIAGERLELGRLLALRPGSRNLLFGLLGLYTAGVILSLFRVDAGLRVMGFGMILLSAWHLRFDIARRTVRKPGLTRFIAVCMLTGYGWLFLAGVFYLVFGVELGGLYYDAQLHALFLGFVFSMIFGHAPIIFPAILGRQIHFHRRFYAHLVLLQLSLVVRLSGDLLLQPQLRSFGGMFNGLALLLFFVNTLTALIYREPRSA